MLVTAQAPRFALVTSGGAHSGWAKLGETFAGWKLVSFAADDEALVVEREGHQATARLVTASVDAGQTAPLPRATQEEADVLLTKMKFELLWDRILVEQRKGLVTALRPQIAGDFKNLGVPEKEIEPVLERMVDVLMAGMQPEGMREDFARIHSEVYTEEELRGMANFYDTAAGKAWTAKQPEVQQRLMQAMMPRVLHGMPEAQKVAADYLRERATPPSAAKPSSISTPGQ